MKKKRICLDPGHYGKRYNAGVVSGYYESVTVWKLTQYEKEYLEQMGIEVLVTRNSMDENPALYTRGMMAAGCDLFVSNHTNACGTESVSRAVVIHLTDRDETLIDDRSREFAMQLAKVIQSTMGVNGYQIYSKLSDNDRDGNGEKDDNYYGVSVAQNGGAKMPEGGLSLMKKFRLSPADAAELADKAKKANMTESEYLRLMISQKLNDYQEIRILLRELINEVNYIGTNFNQIVHSHNSGVYLESDKERLVAYMRKLNVEVSKVYDAIIENKTDK